MQVFLAHRYRGVGTDVAGQAQDIVHQLLRGQYVIDQTYAQGLRGVYRPSGVDHLLGIALSH